MLGGGCSLCVGHCACVSGVGEREEGERRRRRRGAFLSFGDVGEAMHLDAAKRGGVASVRGVQQSPRRMYTTHRRACEPIWEKARRATRSVTSSLALLRFTRLRLLRR